LTLLFVLSGCSGLERSEKEKVRKQNQTLEPIYRNRGDQFAKIISPEHTPRSPYPWETESHLPKITKDFFRCKGNPLNPLKTISSTSDQRDCEGSSHHGLPILGGRENVYPALVELLNFVQKKVGRRVIITCGHRCPTHNLYADPAKANLSSKHQMGAEVDFYVQGMEDQPLEVVRLLMQYYQEHPSFKSLAQWTSFERYEKEDAKVSIAPWMNKEIFIKLYQKEEGRDFDNQHPYPYLSIQIRFDRDRGERVLFDWEKATRGFAQR
jgi:hypothetical protein